jgi:VWFA-related protein
MTSRRWPRSFATAIVGLAITLGVTPQAREGQTFRAAVDLIAVDVQVFGRDGKPVESLVPADFQVSLDGRPRRVVSAVFSRHDIRPPTAPAPLSSGVFELGDGMAAAKSGEFNAPPRTIIIAVDTGSFRSLDVQPAILAAQRFTRQLAPDDLVGVFTLPNGPRLAPSTNHASARQVLSKIVGRKNVVPGVFELSVEQIIDISTAMNTQSTLAARATVTRMLNQVGANEPLDCEGNTALCVETAMNETEGLAHSLEEEVLQGIAGLEELLRQLQKSPGRKTVLLLSSGMPVSDRPAGRPNLGNEVKRLGEQATYANATIHTLFFDPAVNSSFSSEARQSREMSGRTRAIYTRALVEFAEPSGGSLFEVVSSAGEAEIDRLIARLSTYYVLGVEPEARDRDGLPHRLTVKVNHRESSVKNRQLVIVPKPN